ncbi:hypothetical protein [Bradyrhizobium sp. CCBAU 21360]|uniref:hypothetical protein n=1 Tax=Bradyrhizobium sp. CCBAU 21360 TaxID=1325081 RepID=UPI002306B20C|nr:hypothetical protein [Bradyrhizobium sp. CCBAU 21360]
MTEHSATIIDFRAYRMKKRAAAQVPRDLVISTALCGGVLPFYFFWPFMAWIPLAFLDLPKAEQRSS